MFGDYTIPAKTLGKQTDRGENSIRQNYGFWFLWVYHYIPLIVITVIFIGRATAGD